MKTSPELRKLYKESTGNSFPNIEYALEIIRDDNEWYILTIEEYIGWLESQIDIDSIRY